MAEAERDRINAALREHPRVSLPAHHQTAPSVAPDVCGTCWDGRRPGFAVWPCPTVRALLPDANSATTPANCDACDDTGRVPWMVEADPNCYQEPDEDGTIPCPDCRPTPPGEDRS